MNQSIQERIAQLNNLNASLNASLQNPMYQTPNSLYQPQQPVYDEKTIQQMVHNEILKLFPAQQPEPVKPPLTEYQQMMKEINDLASAVLTPEDLQFLNSPDMIKCVPVFLKSTRGKEAMALLMTEYRSYIEGK